MLLYCLVRCCFFFFFFWYNFCSFVVVAVTRNPPVDPGRVFLRVALSKPNWIHVEVECAEADTATIGKSSKTTLETGWPGGGLCHSTHTHTQALHTQTVYIYIYIYAGIYSAFLIFFLPCALLIFYFWRAQMLQLSRQHRNPLRNCARVCVEACACVSVCVVQLPTYPYPQNITVNSATNSWKPA